MRRLAWLSLALTLPVSAFAQGRPLKDVVTIGKVDSVWSATLKENRRILVYTPPSYGDSTYLPRKYPVLYLLDGDAHFHSVTGLLQILGTGVNGTFVVPEMIVVAIPNTDRTRDMTPTHVSKGADGKPAPFLRTSGGMGNFFTFMKTELIPEIESRYRTLPYRVFVGHSLGGITTINALYTIPETFNAYVAIDPSLWYDDRLLLKKAKEVFSKPGLEGRSLYVAQANTISPDDTTTNNVHYNSITQFNSILETYNQSGVRYAFKLYSADDHGSVPMIAEYDALRFIFAGYKLDFGRAMGSPTYVRDHFTRVSKTLGYQVLPPEQMVDMLGRFGMNRDTTVAVEMFRLNAENYPTSPSAWNSLGDGLRAKGDAPKAKESYEKALSLNPNYKRAKDGIEQLAKKQ